MQDSGFLLAVDLVSASPENHQHRPKRKRKKHQRQAAIKQIAAFYFQKNTGHAKNEYPRRRRPPNRIEKQNPRQKRNKKTKSKISGFEPLFVFIDIKIKSFNRDPIHIQKRKTKRAKCKVNYLWQDGQWKVPLPA